MRPLFVVALLAFALHVLPAGAQLGPAGVPGAPGLAETDPSVKANTPPPPATPVLEEPTQSVNVAKCGKTHSDGACKPRVNTKKKVVPACKGKTGKARQQCLNQWQARKTGKTDCSQSKDPSRCEQFQKAKAQCKDKLGNDHRLCLREYLAPPK